ncbi:MAG: RNA polymerase sigma-70 factor, ECF subfamily [Parcubacteria group bacterium Gr01-1014_46]|nr:MAG: RNA polymerase sigma-70 factor, ECF subfamily [Parcubacteria group bacterium Gr01-1014_46]
MNENPKSLSDEELAKLVADGDSDKFGLLMERYQAKLFRYGKKFLVDNDNIEDVVQDVFIKTYKNIKSFDTAQKFSPWIYRIAHNTYINAIKKNSLNPLNYFDFDTLLSYTVVEDPIIKEREQKEIKQFVDKGLYNIEAKYREILVLYYIEELSYKEIADILHIPISTVGVRIMRAKNVLREKYKELNIEI